MSDFSSEPTDGARSTLLPRWLDGFGREGIAIVVLVAFVISLNTTVKFLVSVPLGQWLDSFLEEFTAHLIIGSAMLIAAVCARNAVPSPGIRQYAAVALAVVIAASCADAAVEIWSADGPLIEPGDPWWAVSAFFGSWILRYSFVGLIVASAWLYVRAEAEHVAAISACSVDSERMDRQTAEARLQMLEAQIEPPVKRGVDIRQSLTRVLLGGYPHDLHRRVAREQPKQLDAHVAGTARDRDAKLARS